MKIRIAMNKIYRRNVWLSLPLIAGVFVLSCDPLDLEPENALPKSKFFLTSADAQAAVNAVYDAEQDLVEEFMGYGEARADHVQPSWGTVCCHTQGTGGSTSAAQDQTINPDHGYADWARFYSLINRANNVIQFTPAIVELDREYSELQNQWHVADAYFHRALAYLNILKNWRQAPIVTEASIDAAQDFEKPMSSSEEIIALIEDDLVNNVIPNINTTGGPNRATRDAAYAVLADLYIWTDQYQKALDALDNVLRDNIFADLVTADSWHLQWANGNSNESLYELAFNGGLQEWNFIMGMTARTRLGEGSGKAVEAYPGGDIRDNYVFRWGRNIIKPVVTADGGVRPQGTSDRHGDNNWIIYRRTELWFWKAEALNRLGQKQEAIDIMNDIRARVNLAPNENVTAASSTEAIEYEIVIAEKGLEMMYEGKRWYDLVRVAIRQNNVDLMLDELEESWRSRTAYQLDEVDVLELRDRVAANAPDSWFWPVSREALRNNPSLEQFPAYR